MAKKFNPETSYSKRVQASKEAFLQPTSNYFQEVSQPYPSKYLLPGHIYTFEYLNNVDEKDIITIPDYLKTDAQKKAEKAAGIKPTEYVITKPYYDLRPIGLSIRSLNNDNQTEYVLNIKCMPIEDRMKVMELLYRAVIPTIVRFGVEKVGENQGQLLNFSKRIQDASYTAPFLGFTIELLTNLLGSSLYFWVNKYDKNRIRNIKLIDFDQLEKMAGLDYSGDSFTRFNNTSLKDVQTLYQTIIKNKEQ